MDRRQMLVLVGGLLAVAVGVLMLSKDASPVPGEGDFLEAALPIFSRATSIRAFKLPEPRYADSADLTLESLKELPQSKEIDPNLEKFLVTKLSERSSYIFGLQKPMPFYADYGLVFEGSGTPNVLLISTFSKSARLVLGDRFSPNRSIVNIDPLFPELAEKLNQISM